MSNDKLKRVLELIQKTTKSHPWHGIPAWEDKSENLLKVYVEMTAEDFCKMEVDKSTGYLMVDRPQKFSNFIPAMYGFVPQTFCDEVHAEYSNKALNKADLVGDQDPLDVLVISEKPILNGDILVHAKPIGGLRMLDGGECDDKIIAILDGDATYGHINDVSELPQGLIDRLFHYMVTYKEIPVQGKEPKVEINDVYGKETALEIIAACQKDYENRYGYQSELEKLISEL